MESDGITIESLRIRHARFGRLLAYRDGGMFGGHALDWEHGGIELHTAGNPVSCGKCPKKLRAAFMRLGYRA